METGQNQVAAVLAWHSEVEQDTWLGEGVSRSDVGASECHEDRRHPILSFDACGCNEVSGSWLLY